MNSDSQLSRMLYQSYLVSGSQLSRLLSSDAGTLGWSDPVSHDCGSFVECGPTIMPHSPAKSIFRLHVISSVHTHTNSPTITPPSLLYFLFPSCFSMLSLSLEKLVTCGVIRSYNILYYVVIFYVMFVIFCYIISYYYVFAYVYYVILLCLWVEAC